MIYKLAESSLIHSDFNEYNLMIDDTYKVTMIDFPQMVSIHHWNAHFFFQRDLEGILTYFKTKHGYADLEKEKTFKVLNEIVVTRDLDKSIKASGYLKKEIRQIEDLEFLDTF